MSHSYVPIACAFYDELEAAAVKKTHSTLVYQEGKTQKSISGYIVDFKTKDKEEFLILEDGFILRLDYIISFNGMNPKDKTYC